MKSLFMLFFISLISTPILSKNITLYRSILKKCNTRDEANISMKDYNIEESEIEEYGDYFYIVQGLYNYFPDAVPEIYKTNEWNKQWKQVLPIIVTEEEAIEMGFAIPTTIQEEMKKKTDLTINPVNQEWVDSLQEKVEQALEIENNSALNENDIRHGMINTLKPHIDKFIAVAENANNESDQAFAQYWLAKTLYITGVDYSTQRLPKTSFSHQRHAWPEEERAYESALEAINTYLDRFPDSENAEDMAYHKAATYYHLTYRGHYRVQVELALNAYQEFIDHYPNSDRVARAKLNQLGLKKELAMIDETSYQEVIELGEELLDNYPNATDYIRSRASLIVTEAYYEAKSDEKNYSKAIARCDKILNEFINTNQYAVVGTAYRIKAYSRYFLKQYDKAIQDFTQMIEFWQDDEYHFGYQVEENMAAAYYWRGNAHKLLKNYEAAKADYRTVTDKYPDNQFAVWAQNELDRLERNL